MEYLVKGLLVLAGSLLSGRLGSWHYENVTAFFGWMAAVAGFLWMGFHIASAFFPSATETSKTLFSIMAFGMYTALIRDWVKVLKPSFDRFIENLGRQDSN